MRELWGSITTEEQTQRCRRMAVLSNFISNININIISLIFGEIVFLLSSFQQSAYPGCLSPCSSVVYLGTLHRHKTKFSSCYASLSSTFVIKQALRLDSANIAQIFRIIYKKLQTGRRRLLLCKWCVSTALTQFFIIMIAVPVILTIFAERFLINY